MDTNDEKLRASSLDQVELDHQHPNLRARLRRELESLGRKARAPRAEPSLAEVGTVREVGIGTVLAHGLPHVASEELVEFPGRLPGLVFDLSADSVGVILLGSYEGLSAGDSVWRTGRVLDFPVGDELIGRVVDPTGRPLDELGAVRARQRRAVEQPAPPILERAPVQVPLQTGIRVIDALFPIGRGQRELIVGDRQTGKTSIAVNAILNQRGTGVICIYCAIGKRDSAVAQVINQLEAREAMDYTSVIVTSGDDAPGLLFAAPFAAMTLAEHFMREGRDVLVVYDDLMQHARAYRELSLLLRRPPGREAYPGDIFYLHSRLLERATHLRDEFGGGTITALPIVETYAQNISDYIPTNLISITDGQIYVSPALFRQGQLPAVDIGRSVSRVGGKAQLPAYRLVAGALRLAYSQFEELETFTRFGTQLDEETRATLEHGRRIREVFKQREFETIPVAAQIATLVAANEGFLDPLPVGKVEGVIAHIQEHVRDWIPDLCQQIEAGRELGEDDRDLLVDTVRDLVNEVMEPADGNA